MTIISRLITIAALGSVLNGQAVPTTSDFSGTDVSSTIEGGSENPNYYIDSFVFSASSILPLAYPVDRCVLTSLVADTYARYSCMTLPNNNGYYILKVVSSSSDCTNPSNQTRYDSTNEVAGGFGTFRCDGEDSFVAINAACSSTDEKIMNVVTDVCYRSEDDSSYLWSCGNSGNDDDFDNVAFKIYSDTACTTALTTNVIPFDRCETLFSTVNVRALASESQGVCGNNIDDETTEKPDDDDTANQVIIIYAVLISFIVAIIMG